MNKVVNLAREWGCETLIGEYIPTAKNKMVREFYDDFGFKETEYGSKYELDKEQDESKLYELSLKDYSEASTKIKTKLLI